jgi:hypothetical protein
MLTGSRKCVYRVINLSAPPQAALVGTAPNQVMTAASYFTASSPMTNIRKIYGLVSVNDQHYWDLKGSPATSVYQSVWQSLYYSNPASNDALWTLVPSNFEVDFVGLNCNPDNGTPSHNFANTALVRNLGDGHDDTLQVWNEDIFTYMLLDN